MFSLIFKLFFGWPVLLKPAWEPSGVHWAHKHLCFELVLKITLQTGSKTRDNYTVVSNILVDIKACILEGVNNFVGAQLTASSSCFYPNTVSINCKKPAVDAI